MPVVTKLQHCKIIRHFFTTVFYDLNPMVYSKVYNSTKTRSSKTTTSKNFAGFEIHQGSNGLNYVQ